MTQRRTNGNRYRFPIMIMQGFLPIRWSGIPLEIIAGVTLAALAIPEVMGYTKIAGTPVITGLYTMLIPVGLFAIFGSSRHLVVGADSATAAMLAAGLAGLAAAGSPEYIALAGVLALLAAGFLLLARVFQLGFLANFLSRTILVGFLTGVGIQVSIGQISGMLGLHVGGSGPVSQLLNDWQQIGRTQLYALAISLVVLAVIIGSKRISMRIPGPLIAVIGATAMSWAFGLESKGVSIVGAIPSGMPSIGVPAVTWNGALVQKLLPIAFGIFIVILAQSAATSRAYADRYDEDLNENEDLVGLSIANIGAALSGTFVVNGSPTKTQMVDSAGGQSQLAQLTAAFVILLVLLFLTAPLAHMPQAVLATVVFLIGVEMIDAKRLRRIYIERPWEFWVAITTTIIVVVWGVEQGILLAIFLSLIAHTRHGYRPKNSVVVMTEPGKWQVLPISRSDQIAPGLMIYRFSHSMYYANSKQLSEEVQALVKRAQPPLKWFCCIDCIAVDDIDFSAASTLGDLLNLLNERNIRLVLADVSDDVKKELDRSGLSKRIDSEAYYAAVGDVIDAFDRRSQS
ncbi:MAG: SulP family inorganic anion transporter [Anaerolineales bacterium]